MTSSAAIQPAQTPEEIASSFLEQPTTDSALNFGRRETAELNLQYDQVRSLTDKYNDIVRKNNDALEDLVNMRFDAAATGFDQVCQEASAFLTEFDESLNKYSAAFLRAGSVIAAGTSVKAQLDGNIKDAFNAGFFPTLQKAHNSSISLGIVAERQKEKLADIIARAPGLSQHAISLKG